MPYKDRERARERARKYNRQYYARHREQIREYNRQYKANHKEQVREYQQQRYAQHKEQRCEHMRQYHAKHREQVLEHYGLTCACCGESTYGFLTIDHVNGGGNKHRKEIGRNNFYRWLIKNDFPDGFQTLCFNCNLSKSLNSGICPHKTNGGLSSVGHRLPNSPVLHRSVLR